MTLKRMLKSGFIVAATILPLFSSARPSLANPLLAWQDSFGGFIYGVTYDANGYVYTGNSLGTGLFQCDPATGAYGSLITVAGGVGRVLVSDAAGYVYTVNPGNQLVKINPTNGSVIWASSAISYANSLVAAVDSLDGYIYVYNQNYAKVLQFDASGNLRKTISTKYPYPSGVAVDQSGNVYVSSNTSSMPGYLEKYDRTLTYSASTSTGNSPAAPVVDRWGNIYVLSTSGSTLQKYNGSLVAQWSPAAATMTSPQFASTNSAGSVYVLNRQYIQKFTSSGGSPLWTYMYSSSGSGSAAFATDSNLAFYICKSSSLQKYIDGCNGPFPVTWTDPTITANSTPVRAVHMSELRNQINALRADAGLAACVWTDAAIAANATLIRKAHVVEMRSCLSQVFTTCQKPAPAFTDPTITANNTRVRKIHVDELRSAVVAAP